MQPLIANIVQHLGGTRLFRLLLVALALQAVLAAPAAAARLALVVGIDAYAHVPRLQKAVNDAGAVAGALTQAGFETVLLTDTDQLQLMEGVTAFAARLRPGDEAVFFFAGHGVEIAGQNYLLPADVPAVTSGQELLLTSRALEIDTLVQELQIRGTRVTLLILDACRDNPFRRPGGRGIGGARGLARVDAPEGSFILFSAGSGQTALDRLANDEAAPNSVFTRTLLPYLSAPGLEVREISQRVRSDVRKLALTVQHDQFPAVYDQLDGSFVLMPSSPAAPPMTTSAPAPAVDPCASARLDWPLVSAVRSAAALDAFAMSHADCPVFAAMAREMRMQIGLPSPQPQPLDPPPAPSLEERVRDFVARIVAEWSSPNAIALPPLASYFAQDMIYYGNRKTRAQVVAEKTAVAKRWPVRDYRIEDGSLFASCAASRCDVSAIIDWQAYAPERNATASGRSSYEVTVEDLQGTLVVTRENGQTIQRN